MARREFGKSASLSTTRHLLLSSLYKEGRQNADRRRTNRRANRARRALSGARTPVGVPPRRLPKDVAVLGSAPGQASWDVVLTGVIRAFLSQSSGSTPHTGRNAGEHDARNCPGADCKSARGNRTRSTSRLASGGRPLESGIWRM